MSFNVVNRRVHYWLAAAAALPILVIVASGLLLQAKKHWTWVQPAEHRGTGQAPVIGLEGILASVREVPGLQASTWDDVNRLDVRPGRGVVKVWMQSGDEVQVDLGTGRVLQVAYRRSDVIEAIHDGSFFGGDLVKLGIFLPAGLTLLVLWGTGLWMWWVPVAARRRRARMPAPLSPHDRVRGGLNRRPSDRVPPS